MSEKTGNNVAIFAEPRLPYHPLIKEKFGVDQGQWRALTEAVWPSAKSADSVALALSYCKARNLDPFKRVVHIVPVYSREAGGMVETVWPGIAELRTTAFRTGAYMGRDPAVYGPTIETKVGSRDMKFSEWAQVTVYRAIQGQKCAFPGPRVYWLESYAQYKRDDKSPNAMWEKRPNGQLDKCAEAAALRAAFPEEVGNEHAAEEMEGKEIDPGVAYVAESMEGRPERASPLQKAAALAAPKEAPIPEAKATAAPVAVQAKATPVQEATVIDAEVVDADTGEITTDSASTYELVDETGEVAGRYSGPRAADDWAGELLRLGSPNEQKRLTGASIAILRNNRDTWVAVRDVVEADSVVTSIETLYDVIDKHAAAKAEAEQKAKAAPAPAAAEPAASNGAIALPLKADGKTVDSAAYLGVISKEIGAVTDKDQIVGILVREKPNMANVIAGTRRAIFNQVGLTHWVKLGGIQAEWMPKLAQAGIA